MSTIIEKVVETHTEPTPTLKDLRMPPLTKKIFWSPLWNIPKERYPFPLSSIVAAIATSLANYSPKPSIMHSPRTITAIFSMS